MITSKERFALMQPRTPKEASAVAAKPRKPKQKNVDLWKEAVRRQKSAETVASTTEPATAAHDNRLPATSSADIDAMWSRAIKGAKDLPDPF